MFCVCVCCLVAVQCLSDALGEIFFFFLCMCMCVCVCVCVYMIKIKNRKLGVVGGRGVPGIYFSNKISFHKIFFFLNK